MSEKLQTKLAEWHDSPVQMVRELFDTEPDVWQIEALENYGKTGKMAFISNKGSGKTTTLAWICWNFLLTRPFPKIGATSISGDNLRDGLWSEMSKWQSKAPLLQAMFEWTSTAIFAKDHPQTWRMTARAWPKSGSSEDQANTLAGLHADYIMFVLDETGAMPEAVMVAAEAVQAGAPIEAHVIQAGNPTNLSGPLYKAHRNRDSWYVINITADPDNPKRTKRVSVEYAREQIKLYGRESNWVKANVFGEFPTESFDALIGPDEVRASMKRYWRQHEIDGLPKVIGVDIARYGDDESVFAFREGPQFYPFRTFRNIDGKAGAAALNREILRWEPDAVFLDGTGGWGTSWEDHIRTLGQSPVMVAFNASPHSPRFENKRAEMYFNFVEWIRRGGALPFDEDLVRQLSETSYVIAKKTELIQIEAKSEIKAKLNGKSPDKADACALTFAEPVSARSRAPVARRPTTSDYDPFAGLNEGMDRSGSRNYADYDPFGGLK